MKKLSQILVMAIIMFAGLSAKAQIKDTEKPFVGTWKLMVYGLPNGDSEMYLTVEMKDGALGGTIGDKDGAVVNKLIKASIDKKTFNCTFTGGGYTVPLYIDLKDDGTVEGSMNDMFDIKGAKASESDKK